MISSETVWEEIWPVVEALMGATLSEDPAGVEAVLHPKGQARELFTLFGTPIFDLLLKTVLGRQEVTVTRAIAADDEPAVFLELVWMPEQGVYNAADLFTVKLKKYRTGWSVWSVNPAAVDLPLTEARAAGIIAASAQGSDKLPSDPWLLPVALFAGLLQITVRNEGVLDAVELFFLKGMQQRRYGVLSLLGARHVWHQFRQEVKTPISPSEQPAWAAAVEFIASEQALREQTQAQVGQLYNVALPKLLPCVRHIKETLQIGPGLDERFTALQSEQVKIKHMKDES